MRTLHYICCALCILTRVDCIINNVCPTIEDYYTTTNNTNCWYDFTVDSNVTDIIFKHGYSAEIHKGITPDGYILTIIRIPHSGVKNELLKKGPVFIQHGLFSSAINFVSKGKDSLAFLLADAGYDVWLGNFRGSEYSEDHVNLTTNDRRYWDYSYDEIGLYDIPTQLKIVADKTGNKGNIVYIGHSLGTTVGLVYGSSYPEQAKENVKLFILLAPAAGLGNMISPVKLIAPFSNTILNFIREYDLIKVTSQARITRKIMSTICLESPSLMKRCMELVNLFYGPKSQTGPEMIPVYFNQFPAGTSLKVLNHLAANNLVNDYFGRYNYGVDNLVKYGTIVPPRYQVSNIQVPVFIMYSAGDWACSKKDARILYSRLDKRAKIYGIHEVAENKFNHIDFLYGKHVKSLVYNHILILLEKLG